MADDAPGEYDFITNPSPGGLKKGKNPFSFGNGGGKAAKMKLIIIAGGALALVLLGALVFSFLSNRGPDNKQQLLKVAQQQNELIRISDIGVEKARGTAARNLAVTTKLSLTSDQPVLLAALKGQDMKVGSKELGGGKNTKTDAMLTTAAQANRFDEALVEYLQKELISYQKNMNAAYETTVSNSLKTVLKAQYENAKTLSTEKLEE